MMVLCAFSTWYRRIRIWRKKLKRENVLSSSVTQKTGLLEGLKPTLLKALTRTLMLVAGGSESRFFSRLVVLTSHFVPAKRSANSLTNPGKYQSATAIWFYFVIEK